MRAAVGAIRRPFSFAASSDAGCSPERLSLAISSIPIRQPQNDVAVGLAGAAERQREADDRSLRVLKMRLRALGLQRAAEQADDAFASSFPAAVRP
jgi:hypothetical protein